MDGVAYTGIPSRQELSSCPGVPSEERMNKGRVAVIECVQEIPCNPCVATCKFGAISMKGEITSLPCLDGDRCTGCGQCIAQCPGLAITVINRNYSETEATVDFPYEYLPLPQKGDIVDAVNRAGETVCRGKVDRVVRQPSYEGTSVISLIIPKQYFNEVRSMKRLERP